MKMGFLVLLLLMRILVNSLPLYCEADRDTTSDITANQRPLSRPKLRSPSAPRQRIRQAGTHDRTKMKEKSVSQKPKVAQRPVDFVQDIQPIFRGKCYACHGPSQQMADLRLDARATAFHGGISAAAIIPNKGKESLLYRRVAGIGDKPRMPLSGEKLSAEQIALVEAWIDQGAQWPESLDLDRAEVKKHWAYLKPQRPQPPATKDTSWVRNPIDNVVLARLEQEGLRPSPESSREKLIRRVGLDLIGLPPSLVEVDGFLSDPSPDAYEKLVDRLLASRHYGERWAQPWLDLARYADTHGYARDNRRSMWLYRDWVIKALNADMPFDQFTIEQIAGDLLPDSTIEQKIATGFHRNTMINEEGGVDPEEFRMAAVLDRVDTTATVWLGSTLGWEGATTTNTTRLVRRSTTDFRPFSTTLKKRREPIIAVMS